MPRRLLLVHAHPDDETLTCGITMAHHAERGDEVTVLTCTLGEEGEVIPPELRHLEGHPADLLARHRRDELSEAVARLGARSRVLGEDPASGRLSRYRDSGMPGSPAGDRPGAFARADPGETGRFVASVLRELRPHVVVTYDAQGGYGHPDHIAAHRATRAALGMLRDDELPERTFEILTPRSWAEQDRAWLQEHGCTAYGLRIPGRDDPHPPSVVPDERVTTVVTDVAAKAAKNAALRAHLTQVIVASEDVHALSNRLAARTSSREAFREVDPRSWETAASRVPQAGQPPRPGLWSEGLC